MGAQVLALNTRDSCVPQGGIFSRESRQARLRGSSGSGSLGEGCQSSQICCLPAVWSSEGYFTSLYCFTYKMGITEYTS